MTSLVKSLLQTMRTLAAGSGSRAVAVVAVMLVAACGDGATAPQSSIDRIAAARVMPSVTDARVRLAPAIQNVAVRDRVVYDLGELEIALTNGDAPSARFHLHVVEGVLTDYRKQQGSVMSDGADVSAIGLMLNAVSNVITGGFTPTAF
jgi:hypothetical protein